MGDSNENKGFFWSKEYMQILETTNYLIIYADSLDCSSKIHLRQTTRVELVINQKRSQARLI